jgi:hypothetical protein
MSGLTRPRDWPAPVVACVLKLLCVYTHPTADRFAKLGFKEAILLKMACHRITEVWLRKLKIVPSSWPQNYWKSPGFFFLRHDEAPKANLEQLILDTSLVLTHHPLYPAVAVHVDGVLARSCDSIRKLGRLIVEQSIDELNMVRSELTLQCALNEVFPHKRASVAYETSRAAVAAKSETTRERHDQALAELTEQNRIAAQRQRAVRKAAAEAKTQKEAREKATDAVQEALANLKVCKTKGAPRHPSPDHVAAAKRLTEKNASLERLRCQIKEKRQAEEKAAENAYERESKIKIGEAIQKGR